MFGMRSLVFEVFTLWWSELEGIKEVALKMVAIRLPTYISYLDLAKGELLQEVCRLVGLAKLEVFGHGQLGSVHIDRHYMNILNMDWILNLS